MWKKATFRGKDVWAAVDASGAPVVEAGRRAVRYSEAPGATIYRAGASAVEDGPGPARELPEGQTAPDRDAGGARPGPGRPGGRGSGFGSAGSRTQAQARAAATSAKDLIAAMPPETILAFTDGACGGNPGPAGSGAVVKLPDGRHLERHRALGEGTNNIGELTAIGMALELCREAGVAQDAAVAIFTDSDYARGVLTLNWKPKVNGGLISALKRALAQWPNAKIHWVAGHVGIPENERADELARKGVAESRRM
jgi:ribonuclease HI